MQNRLQLYIAVWRPVNQALHQPDQELADVHKTMQGR